MQIEYYDGQFDDSRYALALAQTAALHGAPVLNHTTATSLVKDSHGKVIGAKVKDNETGAVTTVHARVVINATGPFTDGLRQMADDKAEGIIMPSAGAPRTSARHSRRDCSICHPAYSANKSGIYVYLSLPRCTAPGVKQSPPCRPDRAVPGVAMLRENPGQYCTPRRSESTVTFQNTSHDSVPTTPACIACVLSWDAAPQAGIPDQRLVSRDVVFQVIRTRNRNHSIGGCAGVHVTLPTTTRRTRWE